jgi:hypothetical protein
VRKEKSSIKPWALAVALLALATATLAQAEVSQKGKLKVTVSGRLTPRALPRHGVAPVSVFVSGQIATTDRSSLPQLEQLKIQINRHSRLDFAGLPLCHLEEIQPATSERALAACAPSLVGEGHFSANIVLPDQAPYPTKGRLLVFNGKDKGHHVLLGHIFSTQPFATSFVISFGVHRIHRGAFGTALVASLPVSLGSWGYVTGIEMTLARRFYYRGQNRSFLSAGCPAPKGFSRAVFPLARASFDFAGGRNLANTLTRSCEARG